MPADGKGKENKVEIKGDDKVSTISDDDKRTLSCKQRELSCWLQEGHPAENWLPHHSLQGEYEITQDRLKVLNSKSPLQRCYNEEEIQGANPQWRSPKSLIT